MSSMETSACIDERTTATYSEQAHCKRTIGQQPNAFFIAHLSQAAVKGPAQQAATQIRYLHGTGCHALQHMRLDLDLSCDTQEGRLLQVLHPERQ